jgi:Ca2+-binding RTX toxin-like protein
MEAAPMATARYFEQSFSHLHWQEIVDFNAELIEIPLGTLSPDHNGFAFENVDGTYTVFFGDIDFSGAIAPVFGSVDEILRLTSIDGPATIGSTLASVTGQYLANLVYQAYRDGGTPFYQHVFFGDDTVDIDHPSVLGFLDESPLIETYDGDDVVTGSRYADTIIAGRGNDEVHGHRGDDTIHGGIGSDELYGDRGRDQIFGEEGDDDIRGSGGVDMIDGGAGYDHLRGQGGHDTLYGEGENDVLSGGRGNDNLFGGEGDDTVVGARGVDYLFGGAGDDLLRGGGGLDTMRGGGGLDTIVGDGAGDFLYGNGGNDIIYGKYGDDFIWGGSGDDSIRGGSGFDTVTFNRKISDYNITFGQGNLGEFVTVFDHVGNGGKDTLRGVERMVFDDDVLII